MQQRKDEILAKKAKLAELKRQRELRQKEFSQRAQTPDGPSELATSTPARPDNRKELDSFITSLVGEGRRDSIGPRDSGHSSPSSRPSRPRSALSPGRQGTEPTEDVCSHPAQTSSIATQTLSTVPVRTNWEFAPAPTTDTPFYSKSIQTSEPWSPRLRKQSTDGFSDSDPDGFPSARTSPRSKRLNRREKEKEEELRQKLRKEIEEELNAVRDALPVDTGPQPAQNFPARALTDEELNAVTASDSFLDFVERSSKVIERALDEEYDVLADYALNGVAGMDDDEDEGYARSMGKKGRRIKEIAQFYDERWSKKRMVSDLDFSPKFPELLLASYTKNPSAPQDPSGLLHIWNAHLHSRPEYTFHSSSDVLTARFSPFHHSLILAGTYSGQLLLYDTRSRSPLPVQKTPLTGHSSTGGHTHPIYALSIVGTQNAHNIFSVSTDGVVCGWTVDMLSQPQEYLELTAPPPSKTEDLSPTCVAFPSADPTSFIVGTEEGTIYPCHRYDRAGAKAGVDTKLRYRSHAAPVMSLDFHPARGPVDLGDLVLSSAIDWTVKLWKVKTPSTTVAPGLGAGPQVEDVRPVMEFQREDVIYDAKWSPHRPGVFACVDGGGRLEIWDLATEREVPVAETSVTADPKLMGMNGGGYGNAYAAKSLSKCSWEGKEGKRIAVGGASGVVSVFEVGTELGGEGVRGEEWAGVKRLVGRMERGRDG